MSSTHTATNSTYEQALEWLYQLESRGSKLGLERITALLQHVGNPQHSYPTIHVTGTNGKGSVCQYLTAMFTVAGYKTGLYISPHLEQFTERISINHNEISFHQLCNLVDQVKPVVIHLEKQGFEPTFFEVVTALAFLYFSQQNVDYAVIEVGLGGRFDATNVITPIMSVITNISLEHQHILGTTLEKIAFEKAGIIKQHIPVVTAAEHPALDIIRDIAQKQQAPLFTVTTDIWQRNKVNDYHQEFRIQGSLQEYDVTTRLLGHFQGENLACAIRVVEQLQQQGVFFPDGSIEQGVAQANNPGRMEYFNGVRNILMDGAHNVSGLQQLATSLQQDFIYDRLVLVLGILKDKDLHTMISTIAPLADVVICTQSSSPRSCPAEDLQTIFLEKGYRNQILVEPCIPQALERALQQASPNDLICITGSLFTVGEARTVIQTLKKPI